MEFTTSTPPVPGTGTGFSVVLAERVLREAQTLGLCDAWALLHLGNPSGRRTAYRPEQRIAALLSGLAAGLKGIAPCNSALRPNSALQARLGGRFPDQGTMHRRLAQVTAPQAAVSEFLAPDNQTLMSQLPEVLAGLDAVIPRADRKRVILRLDSHGGTIANVRAMRAHGYHYLCPLLSWAAVKRLREHLQGKHGGWFEETDSRGRVYRVQFWVLPRWRLSSTGNQLYTRATVYHGQRPDGKKEWQVLLTDLKRGEWAPAVVAIPRARRDDRGIQRSVEAGLSPGGGADGSLRRLERVAQPYRTVLELGAVGAGAFVVAAGAGPGGAGVEVAAAGLDQAAVQERAAHSGLRLDRGGPGAVLEVEDTANTAESAAWCRWLQQPIQLRLRLAG